MLLQLVQVVYWLALSTWFGGVLFIAAAAPVIFKTVKDSDPLLPTVLSVNLEGQHATVLAGAIIGNLINMLTRIELVCAGVLLLALAGQWILIDGENSWNFASSAVRTGLYIAATAITIYDWRILWPKIWKFRQQFVEHADDPEIANPARERFHALERQRITLLTVLMFLLLGIVLFSANIHPPTITFSAGRGS
ncbi:MAG: DUF4149 domain-containing protein [Tepidisphaeraceae bacterium]|jgi:hypothetical protein